MDPADRWTATTPAGHPEGYLDAFRNVIAESWRAMRGEAVDLPDLRRRAARRGAGRAGAGERRRAAGTAGMSVRLGINPITWTNDDVPELGGDTPLETCLAETRLAGYAGTELGGKFPRDSGELRADPGAARARPGLRLVRRPHPRARGRRGVRGGPAAPDAPARPGLPARGLRRHLAPGGERPVGADLAPAAPRRRGLARLRPQAHRARRAHGRASASAWPSTTTWAPSSRATRRWAS